MVNVVLVTETLGAAAAPVLYEIAPPRLTPASPADYGFTRRAAAPLVLGPSLTWASHSSYLNDIQNLIGYQISRTEERFHVTEIQPVDCG